MKSKEQRSNVMGKTTTGSQRYFC